MLYTYVLAKEWATIYVRVCSFSGMCRELGFSVHLANRGSYIRTGRHEVVFVCLALLSITPDCVVAIYDHGLCVPAADRAGAEADSELVTVPQWALVCGRYVCAHICTDECMWVCVCDVALPGVRDELEAPE